MPTYDYLCEQCGHVFEAFHGMKETPALKCPECGGNVKKMIGTGAGLIFKGSGFYITDYKNKKSSPVAQPKPTDQSKSKTKSSGKSGDKI